MRCDRYRPGADAAGVFRRISPQYRLGRFRHRQPQSAGLQRLQDRARRRNAVRRRDPGAVRAHRENRFSDGSRRLQIDRHLGAITSQRITDDIQIERQLKVVVDCGNGVAGAVAPARASKASVAKSCRCIARSTEHFRTIIPDPSDLQNLQDLILTVKQTEADIGMAFDGDGDRLGVVTRSGEVIYPGSPADAVRDRRAERAIPARRSSTTSNAPAICSR